MISRVRAPYTDAGVHSSTPSSSGAIWERARPDGAAVSENGIGSERQNAFLGPGILGYARMSLIRKAVGDGLWGRQVGSAG